MAAEKLAVEANVISIAHNGQELGQFSADEVAAMVAGGQIDQTAHYWMEGMAEWRPITEIVQVGVEESGVAEAAQEPPKNRKSKRDPNAPSKAHLNFLSRRNVPTDGLTKESAAALVEQVKQKEEREKRAMTPRQKAFLDYHGLACGNDTTREQASDLISSANVGDSNWYKERHILHPDLFNAPVVLLMTESQRAYLDYHGVTYTAETTREEASALIDGVIGNPKFADSKWNTYKHLIRPDLYQKPERSLSTKAQLKEAKTRLATAESDYGKLKTDPTADPDEVKLAADELDELREEIQFLKDEIEDDKLAVQEREDPASCFVDAWSAGYYEFTRESLEKFKKAIKKPTKAQFKALREKLADDVGLGLSTLSLDQFLGLYLQQFPEALHEKLRKEPLPEFALRIPKTYQQQLQMEGASSGRISQPPAPAANKGCLGLVLMIAAPVGGILVFIAVLVAAR
jgi:hypothetical protein